MLELFLEIDDGFKKVLSFTVRKYYCVYLGPETQIVLTEIMRGTGNFGDFAEFFQTPISRKLTESDGKIYDERSYFKHSMLLITCRKDVSL